MDDRRRMLIGIAAVIVLIGSVAMIVSRQARSATPGPSSRIYFYDLSTQDLFTVPAMTPAPIDAPSGSGLAVRARVFACGGCAGETGGTGGTERFVGWLEKLSDEAYAQTRKPPDQRDYVIMRDGSLIASVNQPGRWFPMESSESLRIQTSIESRCADAAECYPP